MNDPIDSSIIDQITAINGIVLDIPPEWIVPAADPLPALATMTRQQVRAYNVTAHKHGYHLCPVCLVEYERTEANFFISTRRPPKISYKNECRRCALDSDNARKRKRYQTNSEYRERVLAERKVYWRSLSLAGRRRIQVRVRVYKANWRERQRQKSTRVEKGDS